MIATLFIVVFVTYVFIGWFIVRKMNYTYDEVFGALVLLWPVISIGKIFSLLLKGLGWYRTWIETVFDIILSILILIVLGIYAISFFHKLI